MDDIEFYFEEAEQNLRKAVSRMLAFISDGENSLDERWALYTKFAKYLPKAYPYPTFRNLLYYGWFDHFDYSRYETVNLPNVVDLVIENELDEVDIDALKEEIMAFGHGSFVYDW
jgi:hypothetical protein